MHWHSATSSWGNQKRCSEHFYHTNLLIWGPLLLWVPFSFFFFFFFFMFLGRFFCFFQLSCGFKFCSSSISWLSLFHGDIWFLGFLCSGQFPRFSFGTPRVPKWRSRFQVAKILKDLLSRSEKDAAVLLNSRGTWDLGWVDFSSKPVLLSYRLLVTQSHHVFPNSVEKVVFFLRFCKGVCRDFGILFAETHLNAFEDGRLLACQIGFDIVGDFALSG